MDNQEILKIATQALENSKSAHKRIDELDLDIKAISSIPIALARLDEQMKTVNVGMTSLKDDLKNDIQKVDSKVDTVDSKVDQINLKPAERFDKLQFLFYGSAIAAIIGFIASLITKLIR